MKKEFKVLMHNGGFVFYEMLGRGIYITEKPSLFVKEDTIESIVDRQKLTNSLSMTEIYTRRFVDNLKRCELVDVIIEVKQKNTEVTEQAPTWENTQASRIDDWI